MGQLDKTPTSESRHDGLLRNVKIVSILVLVGLQARRVGDPQRDGPLGIPKGNRLFPLGSTPQRGFLVYSSYFPFCSGEPRPLGTEDQKC